LIKFSSIITFLLFSYLSPSPGLEALIAILNAQLTKKLTLIGREKLQFEIRTLEQLKEQFSRISEKLKLMHSYEEYDEEISEVKQNL
jgi:hypothetical protein